MGISIRILAIQIALLAAASSTWAQPKVTLQAEPIENATSVIITFLQSDLESIQGCHYNLFAAKKSRDLNSIPGKGLSVATFKKDLAVVQIIAGPLRSLKRTNFGLLNRDSANIYLRALISCPAGNSGLSDIITFAVPTLENGTLKNIKGYLRDMKFHMKYYSP